MKKYIIDLYSSRYIVEWTENEITVETVDNKLFIKGKNNKKGSEVRKFYFSKNDKKQVYNCIGEDWDIGVVIDGQYHTIEVSRLFYIYISHNGDHISIEDEFISGQKIKDKVDIYFDPEKNLKLENMRG